MDATTKFNIILLSPAQKYYDKANKALKARIDSALREISNNPFQGPKIRNLQGRLKGKFRYRINGIRIIYEINKDDIVVYVLSINPRGDVYK